MAENRLFAASGDFVFDIGAAVSAFSETIVAAGAPGASAVPANEFTAKNTVFCDKPEGFLGSNTADFLKDSSDTEDSGGFVEGNSGFSNPESPAASGFEGSKELAGTPAGASEGTVVVDTTELLNSSLSSVRFNGLRA